jgi:hypothetical protein
MLDLPDDFFDTYPGWTDEERTHFKAAERRFVADVQAVAEGKQPTQAPARPKKL